MICTAAELARVLPRSKRSGRGYSAPCPAHNDRRASFTFTDAPGGGILACCHAECTQKAIRKALSDLGRIKWARGGRSGWVDPVPDFPTGADDLERIDAAARLWHTSRRIVENDHADRYLKGRGLSGPWPVTLGYRPNTMHPDGVALPAMVASVDYARDGRFLGVHRTFLTLAGGKTTRDPAKAAHGPISGGVVRLGAPTPELAIAEGIESALSVTQLYGLTCWATLGTKGLLAFEPPPDVRTVRLFLDGDEPGRKAARRLAGRLAREGLHVLSHDPGQGKDFNDILQEESAA